MDPRHELGRDGERFAEQWLTAKGLRVVDRHYLTKFGELDLIARDGETWVFIEVKTRTSRHTPSALDAISPSKQLKLLRASFVYIRHKRLLDCTFRFDILLIEANGVEWIPNAFEAPDNWTL